MSVPYRAATTPVLALFMILRLCEDVFYLNDPYGDAVSICKLLRLLPY